MKCKWCGSEKVVKNGHKRDGRQQWLCRECGRQMVERPKRKKMTEEEIKMAVKMRDEGMSYRAIARVMGYSLTAVINNVKKKR